MLSAIYERGVNMSILTNLIKGYRNRQKEKYNRRYAFVYKHTFNWFYNLYKQDIPENKTDLPDFYYKDEALNQAKASTEKFMARVVLCKNLSREYARILGI